MPRLRSRGRLILWTVLAILALAVLLVAGALVAVHRSVPTLDGQVTAAGSALAGDDCARRARHRGRQGQESARCRARLGFVHAQERFFEMDLTRRSAAGELSALFGADGARARQDAARASPARDADARACASMDADERALLHAYADGVNAGLAQLGARPWQYLLLRAEPQPWQPVDSLLVVGEMFWMLQGNSVDEGLERAQLARVRRRRGLRLAGAARRPLGCRARRLAC